MTTRTQSNRRQPCLSTCFAVAFFACMNVLVQAHAAQLQGNPETYHATLRQLQPGDELLLEPGVYRLGMPLHGLQGTLHQPITIRGPSNGPPAVFIGRSGHNTISLSNTAHVHIRDLVLDGRNLEVDAIKAEGRRDCLHVHHITLENLFIVGHGADQQVVAIASMCPAWNWIVRRNVIIGAGTGFYLGNPDGSAPFIGALIEQNLVIDTLGYNLQIKHQNERPQKVGMPLEPTRTIIRHNLFTKALNAAQGKLARPNVLLGHFPRHGPGSDDVHELTNNVFFCSPAESLVQAEGHLAITGNIMVNPAGDAISIQPHNDIPKQVRVNQNFIVASGKGISIVNASPSYRQTVANNWLFSPAPLSGGNPQGNRVASFPASRTALTRWLTTESDRPQRFEEFMPLLASASRMCSRLNEGTLSEFSWMENRLDNHPVCKLVDSLANARERNDIGGSELLGVAGPGRCSWK